MQQFLYGIKPVRAAMLIEGPTDSEVLIIGEHFAYLERLVHKGVVLMVGRTLNADDRAFGIVVLTAPTQEEALEIMNRDPAVSQGLMEAELFPFTIALWSSKGPGVTESVR